MTNTIVLYHHTPVRSPIWPPDAIAHVITQRGRALSWQQDPDYIQHIQGIRPPTAVYVGLPLDSTDESPVVLSMGSIVEIEGKTYRVVFKGDNEVAPKSIYPFVFEEVKNG